MGKALNHKLARSITRDLPPLFAVVYARAPNETKARKVAVSTQIAVGRAPYFTLARPTTPECSATAPIADRIGESTSDRSRILAPDRLVQYELERDVLLVETAFQRGETAFGRFSFQLGQQPNRGLITLAGSHAPQRGLHLGRQADLRRLSKLTYRQFAEVFRQSVREFDDVIGTSDPDLSGFRRAGGKLITFVGADDQLIPPGGTVQYRREVDRALGGAHRVNDFYRLFLAPGVTHCAGGPGAAPTNALGVLVDWVEHGKAPATLPAANQDKTRTRDLCPYPLVSRYRGHGDPAVAASYRCTSG